jgi:hypothetical protein
VVTREAALWVGIGFDEAAAGATEIARLVTLPWQAVLLESTRAATARQIEALTHTVDRFTRVRGFVRLIAENPAELTRIERSLPIYMLNGQAGATDAASASDLAPMQNMLRRLTMLAELNRARPATLVVVSDGSPKLFEDLFALWGTEGFNPRLIVIDPHDRCQAIIGDWLAKAKGTVIVTRCVMALSSVVAGLLSNVEAILPDDRLIVRMLRNDNQVADIDLTDCDEVDSPLVGRYDVILSRHLAPILPEDLTEDQFNQFFEGSITTRVDKSGRHADTGWEAFAAGLPWPGRSDVIDVTVRALDRCRRQGSDGNRIILLPAESGAGGTTLARLTAFSAAQAGFPALVAGDRVSNADAAEVAKFLTRSAEKARRGGNADSGETPWLIVFDVAHWRGRETDLVRFFRELVRRARSAVVLCVVEDIADPLRLGRKEIEVSDKVCHDISQGDAGELGEHLNKFLRPRQREVAPHEWVAFWEKHSPLGGGIAASFWVALSFWLRKQLNLSESIQAWLARQFKNAPVPDEAWPLVLEVAALSVEREGAPEGILPQPVPNRMPADLLEEVKKLVPSLALHRVGTSDRRWYIAHDLLGRLLLNIVFYDRQALERFGLGDAKDHVHLRLMLLRRIAERPGLDRVIFRSLALEFPINIFKLDEGRLEFARYWPDVLASLDAMPAAFRKSSRAFQHHAAISRRRICTIREYFDLTLPQRKQLLSDAVALIENAITLPSEAGDGESDLNLYNSLSLAYQNLADVERELGAEEAELLVLWKKATDAAQQAKQLNPRNSYVLETLARNLIQTATLFPEQAAERASEALVYIYEAMSLEKGGQRQRSLFKFAMEAVDLLRKPSALSQASRLAAAGNPFGHLAIAWILLSGGKDNSIEIANLEEFPVDRKHAALHQLNEAKAPNPLILDMQYRLTVALDCWDFAGQLDLLDKLAVNMARMPLQLRLERAVLLQQLTRNHEAYELFEEVRITSRNPASQEYVEVPRYLEWLVVRNETTKRVTKRLCDAKVTGRKGEYRKWAKVSQLLDIEVPYNPREFTVNYHAGDSFKCFISFGYNGPLIKPAIGGEAVE